MYGQQMKKYHWVTSTYLDDMTDETEKLYINEFADGHRRRGMRKLRVPEKQDDYNATTWRIGLFLGIALSLLFQAVHLGNAYIPHVVFILYLFYYYYYDRE